MHRFEHHAPTTLEEVVKLLTELGTEAKLLAGGTDLLVFIRHGRIAPKHIIELSRVGELTRICELESGLIIGACVKLREIERNSVIRRLYPHISEAASQVGSVQIRNLATIGGNLCTASPAGDMIPTLMVSGALLHIVGASGERMVRIEEFFKGPGETALCATDVLVSIQLPPPKPRTGWAFFKLGVRGAMDISIVSVAAKLTLSESTSDIVSEVKVALGSVAPVVMLSHSVEKLLTGKRITDSLIEEAAHSVMNEVKPISDHRASAQYRRLMAAVLTKRALKTAFHRAVGEQQQLTQLEVNQGSVFNGG
ncbi:MAG: xanthine dehydrogenase family protein subunit M [Armatimonadota bacterium]|nr:xanthine dehydrogenase family protein subunit M [Armatimonadota bacterium]MCX7777738.1 xanthine dehydrogenase family protein subunit M [Armatimonadota bacterium]MDW8026207.1 xanthine dehydrogenase family protein subunit M [Armatimonadota bacterium]